MKELVNIIMITWALSIHMMEWYPTIFEHMFYHPFHLQKRLKDLQKMMKLLMSLKDLEYKWFLDVKYYFAGMSNINFLLFLFFMLFFLWIVTECLYFWILRICNLFLLWNINKWAIVKKNLVEKISLAIYKYSQYLELWVNKGQPILKIIMIYLNNFFFLNTVLLAL